LPTVFNDDDDDDDDDADMMTMVNSQKKQQVNYRYERITVYLMDIRSRHLFHTLYVQNIHTWYQYGTFMSRRHTCCRVRVMTLIGLPVDRLTASKKALQT
jgi:hypothetical protein